MELSNIINLISNYFGYSNFKLIKEFIDLNEKKLIENNDLTTYKTFNELELQISLSNLKSIDNEMTKQVQKLYETDEWLVVKPLSYQASLKYGASTLSIKKQVIKLRVLKVLMKILNLKHHFGT
jgi:hypothetical protein